MPDGFFTIEQWVRPKPGAKSQWVPLRHVSGEKFLSDALQQIESLRKPGFFRVVQTLRMVWVEMEDGKLHQRRGRTMSAESLQRSADAFDREDGVSPGKKAKKELAKRKSKKK